MGCRFPPAIMLVSIEVPAFKGGWLIPCIESVLRQTSPHWRLSLVWDGGDDLSKKILERVERLKDPRIQVFFEARRGIARARRFLTERSSGDWILPLDDDDVLTPDAVESFLAEAAARPWSALIRARRDFIDESGRTVDMPQWFPFEPRHYEHGMTTDVFNHCQPYLIRRSAYEKTSGWEGFGDFMFAGEDCDIFLKLEETGPIELLEKTLYRYRINRQRTSEVLGADAALEMWRRLADKTIARLGLPLERVNEVQPFRYRRTGRTTVGPARDEVDYVIPFYEANEEELPYGFRRHSALGRIVFAGLNGRNFFDQALDSCGDSVDRIEIPYVAREQLAGELEASIHAASDPEVVLAVARTRVEGLASAGLARLAFQWKAPGDGSGLVLRLHFRPGPGSRDDLLFYTTGAAAMPRLMMRVFRRASGHSRKRLERCLASLRNCGTPEDAIHVVDERNSSAVNRNTGFRRTRRPFVCFLDDDVELAADTTERLLEAMIASGADLASPKILSPEGAIFCADTGFNAERQPVPRGLGEPDRGQYDYVSEAPWLPSTMLLIRREVFNAVGGFDETYPGSQMEDVDFCLKARRRGFGCRYVGTARIVHFNQQRNDYFDDNFRLFSRKWRGSPELFSRPRQMGIAVAAGIR